MSLRGCLAALPWVLLVHVVLGGLALGGAPRAVEAPARPAMAAVQLVAPARAAAPASQRGAQAEQGSQQGMRDEATQEALDAATPLGQAVVAPWAGFTPSRDLDRAAMPRSAPDISSLEGLAFSGLPIRLRLYVDSAGKVVEVVVLQSAEDDEVVERVRQMFLSTAFIAGRLRGADVASYKDLELALAPPG